MTTSMFDITEYDPSAPFYGTPTIRYLLIDPETKTITDGSFPRDKPEIVALIGDRSIAVPMARDSGTSIMALHRLLVQSEPAPAAAPFWYQPDSHKPAQMYRGKALVIGHSRDNARMASARISLEAASEWMFQFAEPPVRPESLNFRRMMAPAIGAMRELADHLDEQAAENNGIPPGQVTLKTDARVLFGVLRRIAKHFANDHEVTEFDFFVGAYNALTEEGYLSPETSTPGIEAFMDTYAP